MMHLNKNTIIRKIFEIDDLDELNRLDINDIRHHIMTVFRAAVTVREVDQPYLDMMAYNREQGNFVVKSLAVLMAGEMI